MTQRNMAYDNPVYLARQQFSFTPNVASSSTLSNKFVAFTNLQVFSLTAASITTGSSTSTQTAWNGTATCTSVNCDAISLIRISNYNQGTSPGGALQMGTTTYGPFNICPYNGTATATQTGTAGYVNQIQLYYGGTATTGQLQSGSAAGSGGISVIAGDQLYILRGTDASAITGVSIEFGVTPLAPISN